MATQGGQADRCDLDEVERLKIDRTYERFRRLNFYEILDVPRQADKSQIKRRYYAVSKEFHPDRYFRRELGPYKEKLETIFDLITKAYSTLHDDLVRSQYDRSLIEHEASNVAPEEEPAGHEITFDVQGARQRAAETRVRTRRADAGTGGDVAASSEEVTKGKARGVGGAKKSVREERASKTAAGKKAAGKKAVPKRPAVTPLFMSRFKQQLAERIRKGREYFKIGKEAFEKENYSQAMSNLQIAVTYEPNNEEARRLLDKATAHVNEFKAEQHFQRGMQEMMVGQTENAAVSFRLAVECKPQRGHYYYRYANVLAEGDPDSRQIVEYLKLAVKYDPKNTEYLFELSKAYDRFNMPRNAIRELQKLLAIEKDHQEAQKLLKRVKASV